MKYLSLIFALVVFSLTVFPQTGTSVKYPFEVKYFALTIESRAFAGLGRIERQRKVYAALDELMRERVHALTIKARAPGE